MMHEKMAPPFIKGHTPHNKGKMMPPRAVPKAPPVQGLQPPQAPVAQGDPTQNYDWIGGNSNPARTVTESNKRFTLPSTKKQPR